MTVEGTFTFHGPRPLVWDLLQDPAVLARAMPGTKRLERTGPDRFEGVMKISIGPVTAAEFALSVTLRDQSPYERFAMDIDSKGQLGFVRGTARIELEEPEPGRTTLLYASNLQIGGRIAGVGQRVLDGAARMMTRKGLDEMQRAVEARLAEGAAG